MHFEQMPVGTKLLLVLYLQHNYINGICKCFWNITACPSITFTLHFNVESTFIQSDFQWVSMLHRIGLFINGHALEPQSQVILRVTPNNKIQTHITLPLTNVYYWIIIKTKGPVNVCQQGMTSCSRQCRVQIWAKSTTVTLQQHCHSERRLCHSYKRWQDYS